MEEAIASSQIEGAVTTRKKAKEMLRKNIPPKNISEQMILNNFTSINQLSSLKNQKLTPKVILEIHKNITFSTLENPQDEGRFRTTNDIDVVDSIDNEIVYSPPDHKEIPELINALCDYFNNESEDIYTHPIIKGCVVHFMIGWIHPFVDGNGRTARALFYWYMLSQGYWLIEYMSISRLIIKSKAQYGRAYLYTETDRNDLTYFINYKVRTLHMAFESLLSYIRKKVKEKKQFKLITHSGYINERQAEIIRMLYDEDDELLSVRELISAFSVADQTIRNDLKALMEKEIVKEIPLNNKMRVYGRGKKFEEFISSLFVKSKI
jgi:Fic family protein